MSNRAGRVFRPWGNGAPGYSCVGQTPARPHRAETRFLAFRLMQARMGLTELQEARKPEPVAVRRTELIARVAVTGRAPGAHSRLSSSEAINLPTTNLPAPSSNGRRYRYKSLRSLPTVCAGSFLLNDVRIEVRSSDLLDAILARINQSEAGVEASFDAQQGLVVLRRRESGPGDIRIGQDTSGFLRATKLLAGCREWGTEPTQDIDRPLSDLFDTRVQAGWWRIDRSSFWIDPAETSLRGFAAAINAQQISVVASLKEGFLKLTGPVGFALADGTGLAAVLGLAVRGNPAFSAEKPQEKSEPASSSLETAQRLVTAVNNLFTGHRSSRLSTEVQKSIRAVFRSALRPHLDATETNGSISLFGVTFFLSDNSDRLMEIDNTNARRADLEAFGDFMLAPGLDADPNLVERLQTLFSRIEDKFLASPTGVLIDRTV